MAKTSAEFDIIGRVGSIKTQKSSNGGKDTTYVSVATTDSYPDKENKGQFIENDYWHSLTVNPGFENILNKLKVGALVRFRGEIRPWYNKDTKKGGCNFVVMNRSILAQAKPSQEEE